MHDLIFGTEQFNTSLRTQLEHAFGHVPEQWLRQVVRHSLLWSCVRLYSLELICTERTRTHGLPHWLPRT